MLLQFIQKTLPYNVGEVAEFGDPIAKSLVSKGVAIIYREKQKESPNHEETFKEKPMASPVNRKMKARVKK